MSIYDNVAYKKKIKDQNQSLHRDYKIKIGEKMVEIIMKEFNKIETDIRKTLDEIYSASMPDTPNPFHNFMRLGDIDKQYLASITDLITKEEK